MKFAIAKEHRDFFQKEGWIEFNDFLTFDQLSLINQAINSTLAERTNTPVERLQLLPSQTFFQHGHDLWRANQVLRKFITQARFGEIASELVEKKPLRLGYDQLFPSRQESKYFENKATAYSNFIEQTTTLETISSIEGLVCGLMIALDQPSTISTENEGENDIDIFPQQAGNVIFFQPTTQINLNHLYSHPGSRYYLIVYTQMSAFYHFKSTDPHTHALKHLGYIVYDKLDDKRNPIIYR